MNDSVVDRYSSGNKLRFQIKGNKSGPKVGFKWNALAWVLIRYGTAIYYTVEDQQNQTPDFRRVELIPSGAWTTADFNTFLI